MRHYDDLIHQYMGRKKIANRDTVFCIVDRRHTIRLIKRDIFLMGEGGVGGGGAKSDDREKAWSSVNYSILSALLLFACTCTHYTYVLHALYSVQYCTVCRLSDSFSSLAEADPFVCNDGRW